MAINIIRIIVLVIAAILLHVVASEYGTASDGPAHFARGRRLFEQGKLDEAAGDLWKAVLLHGETPPLETYDVQSAFHLFMQCYIQQDKTAEGLAFVALESFRRGQTEMGRNYLEQALQVDPSNEAAQLVHREYGEEVSFSTSTHADGANSDIQGQTPEQLYEVASRHFSQKNYEECADIFEISCERSAHKLGPSCANAVYCRSMIVDYGFNGTQFEQDMERIVSLVKAETQLYRVSTSDGSFAWQRAMSTHPHMMLGYPIDPILKRYVAESVAFLDELMARAAKTPVGSSIKALPDGMPFDKIVHRQRFLQEASNPSFRIKVGFVGSGFNSKAVLYLSQDMFRFFNSDRFEIHVFSFGPPDNPMFIKHGMRGVDWRERVKANVDFFYDCQAMKLDHIKAARFIYDKGIHILIEWDGYARQGERAQGLFALRSAPIQILHQEFLGTSGALYVDYVITDEITTPRSSENLFTEKFIFMPNHFFSKGHAYQIEVKKPTYDYRPKRNPYKVGHGSPQENRCLANSIGAHQVSFVFCNFNKLLKANPETIRSWIRILREVPGSILCLMENPDVGIPYFRKFVHESAGNAVVENDQKMFVAGDGDSLNERIHFLPWEKNPFDHQMRNQDFCNVMLDSQPYNGHTVAQGLFVSLIDDITFFHF